MRFDSDGKLLVSSTGGIGGGSTDMTATNQKLDEIKAYVDELEGLLTQLRDRTPPLGPALAANSSSVTLSTDGIFATNFGAATDPAATSDTENVSFIRLFKRHLQRLSTLIGLMPLVPLQSNKVAAISSSTIKQFRDDFPGTTLDSNKWDIVQTGAGQSITVSNSELAISTGTIANSETIIRSKNTYAISTRILAIAKLSQRIANQDFFIEFVDSSGLHSAYWNLTGNNPNTGFFGAFNNGSTTGSTATPINTSSTYQTFEIESGVDECNFYTRFNDINATRPGGSGGVRSRQIPDPALSYYLQIRVKNGATAPTSSSIFALDAIVIQEMERLSTEITGGRGNGNNNTFIPIIGSVSVGNIISVVDAGGGSNVEFNSPFSVNQNSTSSGKDGNGKTVVRGWIHTDQSGTMFVEQSTDNTNWRSIKELTKVFAPTTAGTAETNAFEFKLYARYYRIRYVNNSVAQAVMHLVSTAYSCN